MSDEWVVVKVAPDQILAEMWVDLLRDEGVPAQIRPSDAVSFLGVSGISCRVLVPEARLVEAEAILARPLEDETEGGRGNGVTP